MRTFGICVFMVLAIIGFVFGVESLMKMPTPKQIEVQRTTKVLPWHQNVLKPAQRPRGGARRGRR